jgi:hypothetical protein
VQKIERRIYVLDKVGGHDRLEGLSAKVRFAVWPHAELAVLILVEQLAATYGKGEHCQIEPLRRRPATINLQRTVTGTDVQ